MSIATRRTPERNSPLFSGKVIEKGTAVTNALTTGGGVETMTVEEVLKGLLVPDCQDAQTWNLPTAALLNAGIPGVEVGSAFEFTVINYGDTTLTIGLGTGVTKTTIATVASVMTIATLCSKRFRLECTGINTDGLPGGVPGSTDSWVVWAYGSIAAAVA